MNRKQRRDLLKKRRAMNKGLSAPYVLLPGEWRYTGHKPEPKPEVPQVPGYNVPPVDPEFTAKVARNKWHDREELDEVVSTIKKLSLGSDDNPWSWAYNHRCKYVDIRIDMRDGGFIVRNDNGDRINLEQLLWQYQSPPGEVENA